MKVAALSVRPLSVITATLILLLTTVTFQPVHAAPFELRFVTSPAAEYSTVSRFRVSVEVIDLATGSRVSNSGTAITLALMRCPGNPGPCSPVQVNNSFATVNTISGLAIFSNLNVSTANDDYYLIARATSITAESSSVFDVVAAHLVFTDVVIPSPRSTLSRIARTVQVRQGSDTGPLDTLANGLTVTLALRQCIGGSGCTPTTINPSLASGLFVNGQRTFTNLVVSTIGTDYYFVASAPGTVSDSTAAFDVVGVDIVFDPPPVTRFTGQSFAQSGVVNLAGTNTVDTMIDGVTFTFDLYRCVGSPGCLPTLITSTIASATVNDGAFSFSGVVIDTANPMYYFIARGPSGSGVVDPSTTFDVLTANAIVAYVIYQGRPSGPVTEPIRIILDPASGGAYQDVTVTATNAGGSPQRGAARVDYIIPGVYDVWVKYDKSLANYGGRYLIDAGDAVGITVSELLAGDADNNNAVTVSDFALLAAAFGRAVGDVGYDARADFNGNDVINIADFSLLASNFGTQGFPQPTP